MICARKKADAFACRALCATATITIGHNASISTLPPLLPLFAATRFYGRTSQKSREFQRRRRTGASREIRQDTWVVFVEQSTREIEIAVCEDEQA